MEFTDELIKKIKDGDMDAFTQLVELFGDRAVNFAYRMLKDQNDAEDAVQEAFLKVFDKIHTFKQESKFSTWFYTVLSNICRDMLRKKSKKPMTVSINQTNREDDDFELQLEDTSYEPHENFIKKDALNVLDKALTQLSDEHREVIVLRDIEGFEYEKIAEILGISLGTVKSRISRARISLRKILEENKELFL